MTALLFQDCALLDTAAGELRPGQHVRIEDGRIVEVSEREIAAPRARRAKSCAAAPRR